MALRNSKNIKRTDNFQTKIYHTQLLRKHVKATNGLDESQTVQSIMTSGVCPNVALLLQILYIIALENKTGFPAFLAV